MSSVIAIIAFGLLIALHELGHFATAKAFRVRVNEFSIGMGPALLKKQGKETLYALRLLPIGGYCAMEGEDGESDDPRAFVNAKTWKKLIILAAGALSNFLIGFLVVVIIFGVARAGTGFATPVLTGFMDGFPLEGESGLMAGDRIVSIDGHRIRTTNEVSLFLSRAGGEPVDLVVERDGETVRLDDLPLTLREYQTEAGTVVKYGVYFQQVDFNIGRLLQQSWYESLYFIRLVTTGLADLFSGAVGVKDLSGPVGIVAAVNDVGQASGSGGAAAANIAYLFAFIAVNLAVMNLLPIPALDGGRIFFMIITVAIEKITRRRVNPKYEAYIHGTGLVLLLGLMAFVMLNDVLKLLYSVARRLFPGKAGALFPPAQPAPKEASHDQTDPRRPPRHWRRRARQRAVDDQYENGRRGGDRGADRGAGAGRLRNGAPGRADACRRPRVWRNPQSRQPFRPARCGHPF